MRKKTRCQVEVHPLRPEERGKWSMFISYSSEDERTVRTLCQMFDSEQIDYLWDKHIIAGSENFSDIIREMIRKCAYAVLVVSKCSLQSTWVNYEIGLLTGLGKPVLIFDPNDILDSSSYRLHFDEFLPACKTPEELLDRVRSQKVFRTLFNNETAMLTRQFFDKRIDENVEAVKMSLRFPTLPSETAGALFRMLIVSFGNYSDEAVGNGTLCLQSREELSAGCCAITNRPCNLMRVTDHHEFPECVLLNRIWEKSTLESDVFEVVLPLHVVEGVTFKLFVDCKGAKQAEQFMECFDDLELLPSLSLGGSTNRVYYSLPNSMLNGLFRLKDQFSNNYLCPGVMRRGLVKERGRDNDRTA